MMARLALIAALASAAALAACDSYARFSLDALKYAPPPVAAQEAEPDTRKIVGDNLAMMFLAQAAPKNVSVSRAVKVGNIWTTCVRASTTGISGAPLGVQTYLVTIEHSKITMRERVDQTHRCAMETFEPV